MPEQLIYSKTMSHWDDDQDWNPAESGQGVDSHSFTVPTGQKYARYSVELLTATMASGYSVESAPGAGVTGGQTIRVKWWYNPFGKIRYTLNVFAGDVEAVRITLGESNWVGKALDAIRQGQNFQIVVFGPQAKDLWCQIYRLSGKPMAINFFVEPVSDTVIVTLAIVLALMAIAAYATMAAILMYAIHEGYNVKATHKSHGPLPIDDELTFEVTKA